ncbi:UBC-like protein [Tilletiaria anomala UBC 951]|uniref:UBC-like protein n=1 Tax=Tilletiaria anomala (strain ATCC 24038 / CBS 436.72 / UBC 951) TaxID=1037660 RepID=A0A066W3A9_TILAU|nr:UBC-like protein [Tilletiaria anomala UBC 951]KDN45260.1 UBC-like protein [Tilletiaria anomala UBC 951]
MATPASYNKKSSAIKRILSEARELASLTAPPSSAIREYAASPLETNLFEWHFTLRGPQDSDFENGIYHGRITLPPQYPMMAPDIMLLTPNGRWEVNKKICLTFTGFHQETWQPAWGIRTALLGVQTFMGASQDAAVGIGALDVESTERRRLAETSREWKCPTCQMRNADILAAPPQPSPTSSEAHVSRARETLPDGLTVDVGAEAKKARELASAKADEQAQSQWESSCSEINIESGSETMGKIVDDRRKNEQIAPQTEVASLQRPLSELRGGTAAIQTGSAVLSSSTLLGHLPSGDIAPPSTAASVSAPNPGLPSGSSASNPPTPSAARNPTNADAGSARQRHQVAATGTLTASGPASATSTDGQQVLLARIQLYDTVIALLVCTVGFLMLRIVLAGASNIVPSVVRHE